MRKTATICLFLICTACTASPNTDSLISQLDKAIQDAQTYDNQKLAAISALKNSMQKTQKDGSPNRYGIISELYEQYKYYNYDSALIYANQLQKLAQHANNPSQLVNAQLKVIFVTLSSGMFKETFDALRTVSIENVADSVKAEYYSLMGRSFYNLSDFNGDFPHSPTYNSQANLYLDSALALYPPNSFNHRYYSALKFLKKEKLDSALFTLHQLIESLHLSHHETALATSTIGGILKSQGHEDLAKPFLVQASIADIKSSTKETLALLTLSEIIFKEGQVEKALQYIEKANADAKFYNARLRKVQVGAILPLIEGSMINTIKTQKEKLETFLILLSVLTLLLAAFALIIRHQVKKLKTARASLYEANLLQQQINQELLEANALKEKYNAQLTLINTQLAEANDAKEQINLRLQETNRKLLESEKIKEEYIGYFFTINSVYFQKIEKFQKALEQKIADRKWDDIKFIVNNISIKKEKEELLRNFDRVFLRLFPNFVTEFNKLFEEEDQIRLKENEMLNTDLRIFALIRMGITENEKIAQILEFSVSTIYNYKTKVKMKASVPKEDFERLIMEIRSV